MIKVDVIVFWKFLEKLLDLSSMQTWVNAHVLNCLNSLTQLEFVDHIRKSLIYHLKFIHIKISFQTHNSFTMPFSPDSSPIWRQQLISTLKS